MRRSSLHLSAHRQCRHQRRGHRDRQHGGDAGRARGDPAFRHHRPVELPRHAPSRSMAEGARHHRPVRHRYPGPDRADPQQGHAECRDRARQERPVRSARAEGRGARMARPRRHGPGADGHLGPALHLGRDAMGVGKRLWPANRARVQRRRHRLRHQAQHPAAIGRRRLQGHGGAGDHVGRRYPGDEARRRVPVERPR